MSSLIQIAFSEVRLTGPHEHTRTARLPFVWRARERLRGGLRHLRGAARSAPRRRAAEHRQATARDMAVAGHATPQAARPRAERPAGPREPLAALSESDSRR